MTSQKPPLVPFETFDRGSISNYEAKLEVSRGLAALVETGQVVGAGSGSTAFLAIHAIADRVAGGELGKVTLIPTSIEVQLTIAGLGLEVGDLTASRPDWLFDGADEVNPAGDLIKGRGGALFREKTLFRASGDRRVIVDQSKRVERLGSKFPVPVEVVPLALPVVIPALEKLGPSGLEIRKGEGKDGPVITELGNVIIDCRFGDVADDLELAIKSITGVIESGLFQGYGPTLVGPTAGGTDSA
jgi:ribose 5-phosphate isomerase A